MSERTRVGSDTERPATDHTTLRAIVDQYFDGLQRHDLTNVPWRNDVELRTPLAPTGAETPIRGRESVLEFFSAIVPAIAHVEVVEVYFTQDGRGVAARADVSLAEPPCVLHVVDCFEVDHDGMITAQENHFDPRPATG